MPGLTLSNITKRFGNVTAVDGVDLQVEDGEFVALLGPSGCGKTTILRTLAGLEEPDDGEISIGTQVVFSRSKGVFVPPGSRNVGMIFQSYALWPHMNVFENIAFGLQIARLPRHEIRQRVASALEMLQLTGFENRYVNEMSGGQQQRVALARMLVTSPQVFLMDEPLSNLDAKLRMDMRAEIKALHTRLGTTCVYVTHDQVEALTLATRIAVLSGGLLQQFGTPMEVYRTPANLFVADFMGNPTINTFQGAMRDGKVAFADINGGMEVPPGAWSALGQVEAVVAVVRPEDLLLCGPDEPGAVEARVESVLPTGAEVIIRARCQGVTLTVKTSESREAKAAPGGVVWVKPRAGSVNLYDKRSGALICASV